MKKILLFLLICMTCAFGCKDEKSDESVMFEKIGGSWTIASRNFCHDAGEDMYACNVGQLPCYEPCYAWTFSDGGFLQEDRCSTGFNNYSWSVRNDSLVIDYPDPSQLDFVTSIHTATEHTLIFYNRYEYWEPGYFVDEYRIFER